ncbi:hypothetical protein ACIQM4_14540 [Streptomyces sp. NPDC091272]|uniref:hypothetical protein n=1 Tax=Streptomyces sp. NPDC091272 TaxID=3365981 RepID=UPI0038247D52
MDQKPAGPAARAHPKAGGGGTGCLLAALGAAAAPVVWAPKAAINIEGGFEGHARDLSVLYLDLPLIVLGGALIPLGTWALTRRWTDRPWLTALAALAALALATWGLAEWWTPRTEPNPGYGNGA